MHVQHGAWIKRPGFAVGLAADTAALQKRRVKAVKIVRR